MNILKYFIVLAVIMFNNVVPETFVCDNSSKNDSLLFQVSGDKHIIRLGKESPSLTYDFSIKFQRTDNYTCKGNKQRCTLLIWRAVRDLEKKLKSSPSSQKGVMEFRNDMLMPGLKYIFNIIVKEDGNIIEQKEMNLDFQDDIEENPNGATKPRAFVSLTGSEKAFVYMKYVINAEAIICIKLLDYHFKWKLFEKSANAENETIELDEKGSELEIPPHTFQSNREYRINCTLFDVSKEAAVAEASQTIAIQQRGLLLKLPIKSLTTRINAPIHIKAFIADLDDSNDDIRINWSCEEINNHACEIMSDTEELNLEMGFPVRGIYRVSIEASKGNFTETRDCTIITTNENIPVPDVGVIETPINPSDGVTISVNLDELRVLCILQWTSVALEGYEVLNFNEVPGDLGRKYNVTFREDLFLSELEEFSNNTISKDYNLNIPPSSESWEGLKGDTKYLFRLIATCPPEDFEDHFNTTDFITDPYMGKILTTNIDVEIETNAPPLLQNLDVQPEVGEALLTNFQFTTNEAEDKDEDKPILYEFGFVLKEKELTFKMISSSDNFTKVSNYLPYSEKGIQTFLKACDNLNSCSKILGPVVQTTFPTQSDKIDLVNKFKTYLMLDEFYKGFIYFLSVIHSFEEMKDNDEAMVIKNSLSERLNEKIQNVINSDNKNQYWVKIMNKLIKFISDFHNEIDFPESVLDNLSTLRDTLYNNTNSTTSENLNIFEDNEITDDSPSFSFRKLMAVSIVVPNNEPVTVEEARNYFQVSDVIITSSSDKNKIESEKVHLQEKLHNFMKNFCKQIYRKEQKFQLVLKSVIATVEKLTKASFATYNTIPFDGNPSSTIAKVRLKDKLNISKQNRNKLCIGKALFRNYNHVSNSSIFLVELFDSNGNDIKNKDIGADIYLPNEVNNEFNNIECLNNINAENEWTNSNCKFVKSITNFFQCSCNSIGYFTLQYKNYPLTTEISTVTTVIETTSTKEIPVENMEGSNLTNSSTNLASVISSENNYDTLSYILISCSVIGIMVLCIILRRMGDREDEQILMDDLESPMYAPLCDEEMLSGHI